FVLNVSSQSVYPQDSNVEKDENHTVEIKTSYAFQKLIIEDFMTNIKSFSINSTVINLRVGRILNPENIKQTGFFGQIVSKVNYNEAFTIANPNNNTNRIHIQDVVDA